MHFALFLFSIFVAAALNGCGARIVTMPAEASSAVASAQTERSAGGDPANEGSDSGNADPTGSAPDGSPSIDDPSPEYTVGEPAVLVEKPMSGNSGEVSFLIDAPDGSTATCSLDRNDPVDCGMSFTLDPVSPGDHTIEIVIRYPNGESVTLEHDWSQVAPAPSPSPAADPKSDDGSDSTGDSKTHRKHSGHGNGHGKDHDKNHGKSDEHRQDGSDKSDRSGKNKK